MTRKIPHLLFVCLGNICRSPAAEGVTRSLAKRRNQPVVLDSAGTDAWHVGQAPDRRMQRAVADRGYDLSGQTARKFVAEDFDAFDLILAMDQQNKRDIEALRPPGSDTPVRLFLTYGASGQTDLADPYYEGRFDAVAALIEDAATGLLASLDQVSD